VSAPDAAIAGRLRSDPAPVRRYAWALLLVLLPTAGHVGPAADHRPPQGVTARGSPCERPRYHEFDFWLGDWRVFDATSGELVGFDHIEKVARGCAVRQNLVFLTDIFRKPELNYRLSGSSVSVVDEDRWVMLWFDDYGNVVLAKGGLQADGSMVVVTGQPSAGRYIKGTWQRNLDGSVTNSGYRSKNGVDNWERYFELVYRPNR
jgi:hypothetical protein